MNNKSLTYLTAIVLVGTTILLALNVMPIFWSPVNEKYIVYNDVRGMAVSHKGQLYTLNFDQQNEVIGLLNLTIKVGTQKLTPDIKKADFDRIVIYQFKGPDLDIIPVGINEDGILFSVPRWNTDGYMQDVSKKQFTTLIENAYDE